MTDFLVAGAGFAGSVIAERLASAGYSVVVCDRRPHIGGNAYDVRNAHGHLIHKYGPHIFHTNSDAIVSYLSRFTGWRAYEHRVLASVDGKLLPIPINLDTINGLYDWNLTSSELEQWFQQVAEPCACVRNSEDVVVARVGRELYEKFFRGYTKKQWGLDPSELDASVTSRIPVRTDRDDRYFDDKHQAMPRDGYTALFEAMLAHPRISLELGVDYRTVLAKRRVRGLIYTGAVDEFFDFSLGKLPYRSLQFRHETVVTPQLQAVAVVNHPNEHAYTRVTEFKHLTGDTGPTTSIVYEHPCAGEEPYYPIPKSENAELYRRYQLLADDMADTFFAGRLATYKYYNMDQVVAQALALSSRILGVERSELLAQGA